MTSDLMGQQRTRRGLLAAAAAAVAGAVAASVARVGPARGADGDVVTVGGVFEGENPTHLKTTSTYALHGEATDSRGVQGTSVTGQGVHGDSQQSAGVAGVSDSGNGVHGQSTSSRGVWGQSTSGPGVVGEGSVGVEGSGGTGLKATSSDGFALHTTQGRLRFDGISGSVIIPAGKTQVEVETAVPVNENTFVLISPQSNLVGRGLWYVIPSDTGKITIKMSDSRPKDSTISYLIMEHAPAS